MNPRPASRSSRAVVPRGNRLGNFIKLFCWNLRISAAATPSTSIWKTLLGELATVGALAGKELFVLYLRLQLFHLLDPAMMLLIQFGRSCRSERFAPAVHRADYVPQNV